MTALYIFGNAVVLTNSLNLSRTRLIEEAAERGESSESGAVVLSSEGSISWEATAPGSSGGGAGEFSPLAVNYLSECCKYSLHIAQTYLVRNWCWVWVF